MFADNHACPQAAWPQRLSNPNRDRLRRGRQPLGIGVGDRGRRECGLPEKNYHGILYGARRQTPRVCSSIAARALSREGYGCEMMADKVSTALPAGSIMKAPGFVSLILPMSRPSKSVRAQLFSSGMMVTVISKIGFRFATGCVRSKLRYLSTCVAFAIIQSIASASVAKPSMRRSWPA